MKTRDWITDVTPRTAELRVANGQYRMGPRSRQVLMPEVERGGVMWWMHEEVSRACEDLSLIHISEPTRPY